MHHEIKKPFAALGIAASLAITSGGVQAEEVSWKMATPWSGGPWLERDVENYAKRVEQLTDGRVDISVYPAGTLYSALKVTEGVSRGAAEISNNWMGYDWGIDTTGVLFAGYAGGLTPEGYMLWIYEGGGLELWQQWREEEFGVVSYPCAVLGTDIFLHSTKKVETLEDFQGLKLRTAGAWGEIASRLGASTVVMPGSEVYSALERGVIDAAEWGTPEINRPTGLQDVAKYVIVPGIQNPGGFLECQVNQDAWNELSEYDQQMLVMAGKLSVYESWLSSSAADLEAFRELEEGPNEIVDLDPAFIEKALSVTREWENEQAAENPWFDKVLTSMRDFKQELASWDKYRLPIGRLAK
ncbi:C4-dicarboxylate ABC transporter substrate-binding protein [Halomonas organivorans]|uniref:TRAP-type mannitol/chloroaromatic compound transport system substrate-binding protein n=1 Tax=Halomonas organivorans TaxID=257772 RepID=A0A7W5G7N0_9GAMM|nr:C4-dicarboxylate ABC transporter substrate-binding protein [Halomonas organivorans]MBB3143434.1 TRAP-type mannitol/chloroaromatic compound transport system substrate-binding protein [Halomonas organivorans]